ncbi:MAG: class I SAM-dependent methyltransferase [Acidobacteria bacterium]|nr:class I SAM-dependent methyltransferase [Acidobacteriota bacterium]
MEKQWYETLFENYARTYDSESFTQGTVGEVDFLEKELGFDRGKAVLDIGCGTGRHAVELARRGYVVTGVDLSESQLARAREKAREAGVEVTLLRRDAAALDFDAAFDFALMLCEGAFSLQESDEKNFEVLRCAARALRPGGKLVMTTLNALFPLFHSVKDFLNQAAVSGHVTDLSFDLLTFRETNTIQIPDDDGRPRTIRCNERYYTPPEIAWLLKSAGFAAVSLHGCRLGAFSRTDPLTPDDFEILAVAEKG